MQHALCDQGTSRVVYLKDTWRINSEDMQERSHLCQGLKCQRTFTMKRYTLTYMVDIDQSVTIRKISKSLHESVENIGVALSRGLGGVSGDDAGGSTHKHSLY